MLKCKRGVSQWTEQAIRNISWLKESRTENLEYLQWHFYIFSMQKRKILLSTLMPSVMCLYSMQEEDNIDQR
jgi:hypothetical protein